MAQGKERGINHAYYSPGRRSELLAEKDRCVPRQDIRNNACGTRPPDLPPFLPMISTLAPGLPLAFPAEGPPNKHQLPPLRTHLAHLPRLRSVFRGLSDPSPLQGSGTPPPATSPRRKRGCVATVTHSHQFRPEPNPVSSLSPPGRGLPHLPGLRPP